ncbi:unnamed protein product, partial [Amoebophrya sp. A25]
RTTSSSSTSEEVVVEVPFLRESGELREQLAQLGRENKWKMSSPIDSSSPEDACSVENRQSSEDVDDAEDCNNRSERDREDDVAEDVLMPADKDVIGAEFYKNKDKGYNEERDREDFYSQSKRSSAGLQQHGIAKKNDSTYTLRHPLGTEDEDVDEIEKYFRQHQAGIDTEDHDLEGAIPFDDDDLLRHEYRPSSSS